MNGSKVEGEPRGGPLEGLGRVEGGSIETPTPPPPPPKPGPKPTTSPPRPSTSSSKAAAAPSCFPKRSATTEEVRS